jgi:hypothetical protein
MGRGMTMTRVLVGSCLALGACAAQPSFEPGFVGTTPCDAPPRAFLGGLDVSAACTAITWQLALSAGAYQVAARFEHGPSVELAGAARKDAATWRLESAGGTLSLSRVGDDLLHVVGPDGHLLAGNGGYSYTLNRAERAEARGGPASDRPPYMLKPLPSGPEVLGIFEGRSPCQGIARELGLSEDAGCIKVKWRVTLFQDPATSAPTTYRVEGTLHWQGAREGAWTIVRGAADATLYRLAATRTEAALSLMKGDDDVLFFLDRNDAPLVGHGEFSYTLNRVKL